MSPEQLRNVLEAAMLAAGRALSVEDFLALFEGSPDAPDRAALRDALATLGESLDGRPLELVEVASGYRLQVRREYSGWLGGLFAERAPRYSRALLETLALIAYRQPITRGEIEDVRGVAVSTNIMKTLMEREWVRVLGHREVPGRPALYGTTREFLDHFGLRGLDALPSLAAIRDLDQVEPDLFAPAPGAGAPGEDASGEDGADAPGGDDDAAPAGGHADGPDAGEAGQPGEDVTAAADGRGEGDDDAASPREGGDAGAGAAHGPTPAPDDDARADDPAAFELGGGSGGGEGAQPAREAEHAVPAGGDVRRGDDGARDG